jgi:hypothetical protein
MIYSQDHSSPSCLVRPEVDTDHLADCYFRLVPNLREAAGLTAKPWSVQFTPPSLPHPRPSLPSAAPAKHGNEDHLWARDGWFESYISSYPWVVLIVGALCLDRYAPLCRFFAHLCMFLKMIDISVPPFAIQMIRKLTYVCLRWVIHTRCSSFLTLGSW